MSPATRTTFFGLLLLAPVFCPVVLRAQQPVQRQAPSTAPASHRIVLDVVVTPQSGRDPKPVSGLRQNDFTLLDNKMPHPITSFRAVGAGEPISVILLVDAVNTDYIRVNTV